MPGLHLLACVLSTPAPQDPFVLAAHGEPACTIVVAATADPAERHAADELARFLGEIAGARFPVAAPAEAGTGPRLLVGRDAAAALVAPTELQALGGEGYLVRVRGPLAAVVGNTPRGTLYGAYALLDERLGCRWFTPTVSRIPKDPHPSLPQGDLTFAPPLEYRATDYPDSRDADWAARNHLNGTQTRIDAARGGKVDYSHFVHTFDEIVPHTEFAAHPEWFSELDGHRTAENAQLCVTNPELLRHATAVVRGWMQSAPEARIFSVSQNDRFNPCQCAACRKAFEEEGQAWSGPYLRFVDAIAAALRDEFPGRAIDTLAYQFTRKPPALAKPLPEVIVRLCSIECCFAHPLEAPAATDPANAAFVADLAEWSRRSQRLYVWDYVIDYSHTIMPFPNLFSIAPNVRTFVGNGVKGVYEEADYFTPGGEFAELRAWLLARALWDPRCDTRQAIAEFLAGFYGAAAGPLGDYIRMLHERAAAEHIHFTIWTGPDSPLFDAATLAKADALFDAAEAAVRGDAAVAPRVRTARLPLQYVEFCRAPTAERLAAFDAGARAAGIVKINEWQPYADWFAKAQAQVAGK